MTALATVAPVEVGDYFVSSWGYDQTNVDFYRVVGLTKSGKSVRVQKWTNAHVGDLDGPHDRVVPGDEPATYVDWSDVPEGADYWEREEHKRVLPVPVETKRMTISSYDGSPRIAVRSYAHATKWDGEPEYQTGYGYGH